MSSGRKLLAHFLPYGIACRGCEKDSYVNFASIVLRQEVIHSPSFPTMVTIGS